MPVKLKGLDHFVLTVADIERAVAFYEVALGMTRVDFGEGRVALGFGAQKINLHPHPTDVELVAADPRPGTADFCLLSHTPVIDVKAHLESLGVEVIEGPVERTGAQGKILSVYFRDPDGNLVEVANQL